MALDVGCMQVQEQADAASTEPVLPALQGGSRFATDIFFASTRLRFFEFVLACIGIAQVAIVKDQAVVAKV